MDNKEISISSIRTNFYLFYIVKYTIIKLLYPF